MAATFVVTSNADSGPGTLRQALLDAAANGNADKDFINFNITDLSEAGRTINLLTQLPDLSSNLIIDGSTQAGSKFGGSDAKIEISTPVGYYKFNVFTGNGLNDVEFYSLYLHDYFSFGANVPDQKPRSGIYLTNSSDITFGLPNKGNLIDGFSYCCLYLENVTSVKIQSNVLGELYTNDQNGLQSLGTAPIYITGCTNIIIGGDNLNEGNIIHTLVNIYFNEKTNDKLTISSNNFRVAKDGKTFTPQVSYGIGIIQIATQFQSTGNQLDNLSANVDFEMKDNLFNNIGDLLDIFYLSGQINFIKNHIGISRDGQTPFNINGGDSFFNIPIKIQSCPADINFGDNNPDDRNFFYYVYNPVDAQNTPNITLRYNDFKCITYLAYNNRHGSEYPYTLPFCTIGSINTNGNTTTVKGLSTANAEIQLYSSETCSSACSIRSYIQTVYADNSGNWQADLPNLNGLLYASATVGKQTSLFKTFEINTDAVVNTGMRCTDQATITGLKIPQGLNSYWVDSRGNIVSHDLDLTTNQPGDYYFVLGDGCIKSNAFHVHDNRIYIYDGALNKTAPGCGLSNGAIKNLIVSDPLNKINSEIWTNNGGTIVGNTLNVSNLASDIYKLTIKTTDGCSATYSTALASVNAPNIDQSTATITPTPCGQSAGSITGITATGTGTLSYSWKNANNQQVATTKDLQNQPAGSYTLQVTDGTACGPVYTSAIVMPEVNGISMDESQAVVAPTTCAANSGSVKNIAVTGATTYQWYDINNVQVGTSVDLTGVAGGTYHLVATNGSGCSKTSHNYTIFQPANNADYGFPTRNIVNTTCGLNNGSIEITFSNTLSELPKSFRWVNHTTGATIAATTVAKITGLAPGTYELYLANQAGCEMLWANNLIVNAEPGLHVSFDILNIHDDHCQSSSGSIEGIRAGGTAPLSFTWTNDNGAVISTDFDLYNLKAGIYHLKITDGGGCEQDLTYEIKDDSPYGVAINDAAKIITAASCPTGSNGSITGISVIGATTYDWRDANDNHVSSSNDLVNVPAGKYYLVASNPICTTKSNPYIIPQQTNNTDYGGATKVLNNATCGLNNGSIEVVFTNNPAELPKLYRWVNHSTGQTVATTTTPKITSLDAGSYDIYVTNNTGCERLLINYTIGRDPQLVINPNNIQVTDDNCQTSTGSIKGIVATGKAPINFAWTNNNGQTVSTSADLLNVPPGTYHLKITDGAGCEQGLVYTVNNINTVITPPSASDIQICSPGDAYITVNNPIAAYSYKLYDDALNTTLLGNNNSGRFKVNVSGARSYYVSAYTGNCESSRVELKVSLGSISTLNLANTFSPNGDGINDTWKIPDIGNYPNASVQIFTRSGQKIFESVGYATPFNGNYSGKPLPTGVYYYIINMNAGCGILSGNLTLIR